MKNTIVLVIALVLTTVNNPILTAKPRKRQTSEAGKAKTELKAAKTKRSAKARVQKPKSASAEARRLKAEAKEWQKRKKDMEPLQLKDLVEENHRLKTHNLKLGGNVQELEEKLEASEESSALVARLKNEIDTLKKAAISTSSTPIALEELPAGSYSVDEATGQVLINGIPDDRYVFDKKAGKLFIKGVIFKVQVGADIDLDLSDVLVDDSPHKNLEQEEAAGLNKYTIGYFRNYWKADKLKKGLRKMGIRRAWIVPYKDGKRVLLKEVLSTVIEQKE